MSPRSRTICWVPTWNERRTGLGLEHLLLADHAADGVILGFAEDGVPFRVTYRLAWQPTWQLREARLVVATDQGTRALELVADGRGHWRHADGGEIAALVGCTDVDIWPTPFTNTFPLRRESLHIGERREIRVAWISAPELAVVPKSQAYTRLAERRYRFESLDASGFTAELEVDEDGVVLDYPGLFRRVRG